MNMLDELDELDEYKEKDLTISLDEVVEVLNKNIVGKQTYSKRYIAQAIKNGTFPGSYVETNGKTKFLIPRYAFYQYMGILINPSVNVVSNAVLELVKEQALIQAKYNKQR